MTRKRSDTTLSLRKRAVRRLSDDESGAIAGGAVHAHDTGAAPPTQARDFTIDECQASIRVTQGTNDIRNHNQALRHR